MNRGNAPLSPLYYCLLRSLGTGSGAEEEEAPLKSRYGRDLVVADGVNLDSDPEQVSCDW